MPLPPYIAEKRAVNMADARDYQTIFAREPGSVVAPTAGLHFMVRLLPALAEKDVQQERATLHVGLGTILPVMSQNAADHRMHAEHAALSWDAAARLKRAGADGRRIVAAATTALRVLESAVDVEGRIAPIGRDVDIFITPCYASGPWICCHQFPSAALNSVYPGIGIHGLESMTAADAEAIREKYCFYSYGNACLLLGNL